MLPRAVGNEADDAIFLADSFGLVPDEWQENVLRGWLGVLESGRWAAPRCGLSVPRQNGKNGALEVRELFGMVALGERILHTAHEVKTARKAFLRIASFFEDEKHYPELASLVVRNGIRKTNGQEAIYLTNGGSIEFIARSRGSGRGFSVDVLVMDEAQDLDDDSLAALLPTISASPNPQTIVTGTPPDERTVGEVFARWRAAGVEGVDERLCWMEWSFEDGADLDDPQVWADANPALGIRLSLDTIRDERAAMDDETFARERGGVWGNVGSSRVIAAEWWDAIGLNHAVDAGGEMSIAIDMSPDRDMTSLVSVQEIVGGLPCIEVKDTKQGAPEWVVPRVVDACKRFKVRAVVIDGAGPAASLIDALKANKIEVTVTGASQMKRACGAFFDAVVMGSVRHLNQAQLNSAVGAVRKRKLEDAFAWQRKSPDSDITPVVAATLALWGFTAVDVKKPIRRSGGATFA